MERTTFLAGYFFASPSAAKFCSQHLDCAITFVNQIPTQLLVGPASPISHPPSTHQRYTMDMFSVPRPQYITPSPASLLPASLVLEGSSKVTTKEIRKLAVMQLKPTGQGKGEAIGFFEQGIITGVSILLGVVVPTTLYGTWILGRKGFQYFRRWWLAKGDLQNDTRNVIVYNTSFSSEARRTEILCERKAKQGDN